MQGFVCETMLQGNHNPNRSYRNLVNKLRKYSTVKPQSRQSTKLSLQSSELGHTLTRMRVCFPLPFGSGGRAYSLAGEGMGGGSQFQRGDGHCGTLGIYVLCVSIVYTSEHQPPDCPSFGTIASLSISSFFLLTMEEEKYRD
jgi:hypothetical protein